MALIRVLALPRGTGPVVIRDELSRLFSYEERHRRLLAQLMLASGLTVVCSWQAPCWSG